MPRTRYAGGMRALVAAAALLLLALPAEAQSGGWLVQPPAPWNFPGALPPVAPAPTGDPPGGPRCADTVRPPRTPQEQALADGGWSLFNKPRVLGLTTILLAEASVDGMCRPWQFQAFVFVGLRFAGTLSPVVMNSRSDGSLGQVRLVSGTQIEAVFLRYATADPLCCPSRLSVVRYGIELPATLPRVVPLSVRTTPAPWR